MVICCDTSFLISLYGNDSNSSRAVRWVSKCDQSLSLTPFNYYELGNAIRFAEFKKLIASADAALYWAQFESAIRQGRIIIETCNLAAILSEVSRLSQTYTRSVGHRSFDIIHVAGALQLGAGHFLTFDNNQIKLARSEGLKCDI